MGVVWRSCVLGVRSAERPPGWHLQVDRRKGAETERRVVVVGGNLQPYLGRSPSASSEADIPPCGTVRSAVHLGTNKLLLYARSVRTLQFHEWFPELREKPQPAGKDLSARLFLLCTARAPTLFFFF